MTAKTLPDRFAWGDDDIPFLRFTARDVVNGSRNQVDLKPALAEVVALSSDDEPGAARK